MNRNILCAGALLLTGFFMTDKAEAYRYTKCGDGKVIWSSPFGMIQNLDSIAPGGQREDAMNNAIDRWRNVRGMNDMVFLEAFGFGSSITFINFKNDVAVVPRPAINGNNGLTLMLHDGCFFGGDMEWIEADVMVAGDMTFGPTGETSLATSGRMTFIHEFGHAHGLLHAQRFNHMRRVQPRPRVGGPGETVDVLPDDANGGRFLYPSGKTEVNLFATAHRRISSSDTITRNNSGTFQACSKGGASLTINSTVGNNGTVDVKQTERWWVSQSDQAHGGGIQIGEWKNGTFLAGQMHTRSLTWKLPALPAGTYFLYHGVDVLHEVDESREDDNAAREALVIEVVDC
jgi:hypothetical protein